MSEKTCWLLASYQWLLYIYPHLMVPYANTCQMLSKAYTTFTPFPALPCVWRGKGWFSMTYGVTLLHTKEAYLHPWFYNIWENLSSQPFFTLAAIAIMSFPVYILLGIDVTNWRCKYTFYSDSCYELDKHVQKVKKGWIPTYYKPFTVTDHAVYIYIYLSYIWPDDGFKGSKNM